MTASIVVSLKLVLPICSNRFQHFSIFLFIVGKQLFSKVVVYLSLAMTGAPCLLIAAACLTGCLVEGDREYDPPALPQLFSGTRLSRVLAHDPRLWPVLKKRLGAGGDRRCSADQRRNNTIIKTKDSLDAGAQFITAPSVTNYRDCEDECCREKTCNTVVVNLKKSKVPVSVRGRLVFAFAGF